jgi:hypothetical protein
MQSKNCDVCNFVSLNSIRVFSWLGCEVILATGSKNIIPHKDINNLSAYQETRPLSTEPEGSLSYSKIF